MALPLPDLDTRSFADLVDEARAAIPRYARDWTDHNLSDPGITLTELVAAQIDRLMYSVNRITERDRRTLLRLLGFAPLPPRPAHTVISFALRAAAAQTLPQGLVVGGRDPGGEPAGYRTLAPVRVGYAALGAAQVQDGNAFSDHSQALLDGDAFAALGDNPQAGRESALLLGFDPPPDANRELALWLALADSADPDRIEAEFGHDARTTHHDAAVAWEWFDGTTWSTIDGAEDGTRALTVSGPVRLKPPVAPPLALLGAVTSPRAWLRCRLASGRLDAAPRLRGVAVHAVAAVQAVPVVARLTLAPGCQVTGAPVAGTATPLALEVDADGSVTALASGDPLKTPPVQVLDYRAPTPAAPGALLAAIAVLGHGTRSPGQAFALPRAPAVSESVAAWVTRGTATEPVRLVPSLDASPAHALDALLDVTAGTLQFGDGRRGRMVAEDELVVVSYERTDAKGGMLRAHAAFTIAGADGDANRARLGGAAPSSLDQAVSATAPWPSRDGADAEDVTLAAGRASRLLFAHERLLELLPADGPATLDGLDDATVAEREAPERATNGPDLERIALDTPGCGVARARAWPALDARYPGMTAAGTATVVILPELPAGRPQPSPGLLGAVRQALDRRRLVGSRIVVAGPDYVEVRIVAKLRAAVGYEPADVAAAARVAVDAHLDPLTGGRDGRGWPFGRDVYRAEILGVLDEAHGVDFVAALELIGPSGESCGNVCIPPAALAAGGEHQIEATP